MLSLKANKKLVQDNLTKTTGKTVLLKDLSNIVAKMKSGNSRNDLQECVKNLTDTYGKLVLVPCLFKTYYILNEKRGLVVIFVLPKTQGCSILIM